MNSILRHTLSYPRRCGVNFYSAYIWWISFLYIVAVLLQYSGILFFKPPNEKCGTGGRIMRQLLCCFFILWCQAFWAICCGEMSSYLGLLCQIECIKERDFLSIQSLSIFPSVNGHLLFPKNASLYLLADRSLTSTVKLTTAVFSEAKDPVSTCHQPFCIFFGKFLLSFDAEGCVLVCLPDCICEQILCCPCMVLAPCCLCRRFSSFNKNCINVLKLRHMCAVWHILLINAPWKVCLCLVAIFMISCRILCHVRSNAWVHRQAQSNLLERLSFFFGCAVLKERCSLKSLIREVPIFFFAKKWVLCAFCW